MILKCVTGTVCDFSSLRYGENFTLVPHGPWRKIHKFIGRDIQVKAQQKHEESQKPDGSYVPNRVKEWN